MAQPVKVLATKPDDLRSIPGTQLVEGENRPKLSDLHTCYAMFMTTHEYTQNINGIF